MKRSEINALIKESEQFIENFNFALPPFASYTPKEWAAKGNEYDDIRRGALGWDITDYGLGRFYEVGLVLITIRNGYIGENGDYSKPYAEKLLISRENQVCPMHFHWHKMEDIINRGGGILVMQLYNSTADGDLDITNDVDVLSDGVLLKVPAGTKLELASGQSVTLNRGMYHAFWAKESSSTVLIGEVSQCNDDNTDNRFLEPIGRFPKIEEDELPYRLLCNEYPTI